MGIARICSFHFSLMLLISMYSGTVNAEIYSGILKPSVSKVSLSQASDKKSVTGQSNESSSRWKR